MARILTNNIVINFGDKVWSTDEIINAYPWALVGVETEATFNGDTGGVDTYTNLNKDQFYSPTDYSQAITVGDMKSHVDDQRVPGAGISGKLTINGGFYASPASCIYVAQGECIINGGTFMGQPDHSTTPKPGHEAEKYPYGRNFLLNLYDTNRTAGKAKIYVKGGSFVGFDPADNYAEEAGTNFVCVGYKSVEDGEYTYTVKDRFSGENGTLRTVKVYTVVPESDQREGISGTQTLPNE